MLKDFIDEFARYRSTAERAMEQVSDDDLNRILAPDGNSVAMVVRHISGNLTSRFTNFLSEDGEKPWRDRDSEFADRSYSRTELDAMWTAAWDVVRRELDPLTDADLETTVTIRGQQLTVHEALCRSVAHTAMHVGQIILLARILAAGEWRWITIPKGKSREYNQNPTMERR